MSRAASDEEFLWRLQRQLPLPARGKAPLTAFLRGRIADARIAPRLKVTNVFSLEDGRRLMCQFIVDDAKAGDGLFVAPLDHVAFDRAHPIARELAARRWRVGHRETA